MFHLLRQIGQTMVLQLPLFVGEHKPLTRQTQGLITFLLGQIVAPHGAVAQSYGVFHEGGGMPIRGTFLVDTQGIIRWALVNGPGETRDFGGLVTVMREIRAGAAAGD